MANYSISQLPTEATAQSTDLIETAIVDANSASGYASRKETLAVVGEAVVSDFQFPLLLTETTDKTIVGAINEVAQNAGGNVADEIANLKTSTDATIAGGVATFDALDSLPLDALTIGIEYTQSGSGTPSPDNVRTINGFASAVISVTDGDTTETKTISFGSAGTVYKGTLNVLTGELTVTHSVVDLGTLTWAYENNSYFSAKIDDRKQGNAQANIVFDSYAWSNDSLATMGNFTAKGAGSNKYVFIKDNRYTDADAFTTAVSGHYLYYELATSLSYQLTPTEIKSLIGSNTLSADCGDVTICKYTALERIENQVTQYSTSEQKTGRKWVNGKDLYTKSWQITLPSAFNPANSFLLENDASYIEYMPFVNGTIKTTDGYIGSIGMNANGWKWAIHRNPSNQIVIYSADGASLMSGEASITIEYTKN